MESDFLSDLNTWSVWKCSFLMYVMYATMSAFVVDALWLPLPSPLWALWQVLRICSCHSCSHYPCFISGCLISPPCSPCFMCFTWHCLSAWGQAASLRSIESPWTCVEVLSHQMWLLCTPFLLLLYSYVLPYLGLQHEYRSCSAISFSFIDWCVHVSPHHV